ncbi:MAG: hypothetical protein V3S07_04865 [Micropepsaceae bacterium]
MSKHKALLFAAVSCLIAPMLQGAAPELGEVVGDNVYTNCEYRLAAIFPGEPMIRDFTYRDGERNAPARQFYLTHNGGFLSVTVAHFADGPEEDQSLVDSAAAALHARGELRFEESVFYDTPRIPGRQYSILLADGRFLRGSVYTARNRLYITEAISDPADADAFRFEQSVSMIDENGTDLDGNPVLATPTIGPSGGLPSRQYDCGS